VFSISITDDVSQAGGCSQFKKLSILQQLAFALAIAKRKKTVGIKAGTKVKSLFQE